MIFNIIVSSDRPTSTFRGSDARCPSSDCRAACGGERGGTTLPNSMVACLLMG